MASAAAAAEEVQQLSTSTVSALDALQARLAQIDELRPKALEDANRPPTLVQSLKVVAERVRHVMNPETVMTDKTADDIYAAFTAMLATCQQPKEPIKGKVRLVFAVTRDLVRWLASGFGRSDVQPEEIEAVRYALRRVLEALQTHLEGVDGARGSDTLQQKTMVQYRSEFGAVVLETLADIVIEPSRIHPIAIKVVEKELPSHLRYIAYDVIEQMLSKTTANKELLRQLAPAVRLAPIIADFKDYHLVASVLELAFRLMPPNSSKSKSVDAIQNAANRDRERERQAWADALFPIELHGKYAEELRHLFSSCQVRDFLEGGRDILHKLALGHVERAQRFIAGLCRLTNSVQGQLSAIKFTSLGGSGGVSAQSTSASSNEDQLEVWFGHDALAATCDQLQEDGDIVEERWTCLYEDVRSVTIKENERTGDVRVLFELSNPPFFGPDRLGEAHGLSQPNLDNPAYDLAFDFANSQEVIKPIKQVLTHRALRYPDLAISRAVHPLLKAPVPSQSPFGSQLHPQVAEPMPSAAFAFATAVAADKERDQRTSGSVAKTSSGSQQRKSSQAEPIVGHYSSPPPPPPAAIAQIESWRAPLQAESQHDSQTEARRKVVAEMADVGRKSTGGSDAGDEPAMRVDSGRFDDAESLQPSTRRKTITTETTTIKRRMTAAFNTNKPIVALSDTPPKTATALNNHDKLRGSSSAVASTSQVARSIALSEQSESPFEDALEDSFFTESASAVNVQPAKKLQQQQPGRIRKNAAKKTAVAGSLEAIKESTQERQRSNTSVAPSKGDSTRPSQSGSAPLQVDWSLLPGSGSGSGKDGENSDLTDVDESEAEEPHQKTTRSAEKPRRKSSDGSTSARRAPSPQKASKIRPRTPASVPKTRARAAPRPLRRSPRHQPEHDSIEDASGNDTQTQQGEPRTIHVHASAVAPRMPVVKAIPVPQPAVVRITSPTHAEENAPRSAQSAQSFKHPANDDDDDIEERAAKRAKTATDADKVVEAPTPSLPAAKVHAAPGTKKKYGRERPQRKKMDVPARASKKGKISDRLLPKQKATHSSEEEASDDGTVEQSNKPNSADTGEVTDYEDAQPPRAFKRHAAASTSKKVYPKQPVKKTITTLDQLVNDSTSRQPSPVPVSLKTHAAKRTVDGDSEPIDEPDTEDQEISDKAAEAVIERQARPISANEGELAAQDLPVNRNVWQSANEVDPQSVDVAIEVNPSDQASDVEMEAGKAEGIEAGVILMERAGTFIGSHLIQRREFPEDPLIADSQEGPALALDLQAVYEVDEDDGLQEDDLGVEVDDSGFYDAHDVSVLHDKRMGKIVEIDNEDSEAGSRHEADEELEADEVLVPGTSQPDDADELYEQQVHFAPPHIPIVNAAVSTSNAGRLDAVQSDRLVNSAPAAVPAALRQPAFAMKQSYLSTGPALFDATATSTTFAHDTRPTEHRLIISPKKFQPTSPSSQSLLQAIKSNQCQHSSLQQPQARAPQHQLTPPPPRQYPRFDFGPMTRPAPSTAAAAPGSKSLKSGQGRRKPDAPPSVARARQPRQVTSEPPERERRQEAEWDQTRDLISSIMNHVVAARQTERQALVRSQLEVQARVSVRALQYAQKVLQPAASNSRGSIVGALEQRRAELDGLMDGLEAVLTKRAVARKATAMAKGKEKEKKKRKVA